MTDIVERLRDLAALESLGCREDCAAAADEIERLRVRLGSVGLEVVMIDNVGHYVNTTVRDEIEKLRAQVVALQSSLEVGKGSGKKTP